MKPYERLRNIAEELGSFSVRISGLAVSYADRRLIDASRAELESIAADLAAAEKPQEWSPLLDDWYCQCGQQNHQTATACTHCRRIGWVNESGKIVCSRPDANQLVIGFTPSLPVQLNGHNTQGTTTAGKISAHRR